MTYKKEVPTWDFEGDDIEEYTFSFLLFPYVFTVVYCLELILLSFTVYVKEKHLSQPRLNTEQLNSCR